MHLEPTNVGEVRETRPQKFVSRKIQRLGQKTMGEAQALVETIQRHKSTGS